MKTISLGEIAKTIRSKNAGAHYYTLDVMFTDPEVYRRVKESGVLSRETIAEVYGLPIETITHFFAYDPGLAFKASMRRSVTSGDVGETDVYGAQQYIPLLDIQIPWE